MKQIVRTVSRIFLLACMSLLWMLNAWQSSVSATQARQQWSRSDIVRHSVSDKAEHIRGYWTSERMQRAIPASIAHPQARYANREPEGAWDDSDVWTTERMHHAVPAEQILGKAPDLKLRERAIVPSALPVPPGAYNSLPYSAEGKVFFTDPQTGLDYLCSGTALISQNRSVVDTAGHCVIEGGSGDNFYTNWIFCPQYLNGNCPRGQWSARELITSTQWADNGTLSRDIGFAIVGAHNGQRLTDAVRSVNIITGLSRNQTFTALGYPAMPPFDGEHMQSCRSGTVTTDSSQGSPATTGIDCNMNGGSSGGGWLIRRNNTWYLNGHVSYRYSTLPDVLFSPYYDSFVRNIYNQAQIA